MTYDSDETLNWDQTVMSADTGPVQIRSKRTKPRHVLSLVYQKSIDQAGMLDALQDFFRAQCNPFTPFYLYSNSMWHRQTAVSAGTGTGSQLAFPFPGREVDPGSDTVTVAGAVKVNGTDYALGHENRCLYSEDFSQTGSWQVGTGATVTRTSGQTDPLGGTKAWRIQTSGGSSVEKMYQYLGSAPTGMDTYIEVWIKVQGSNSVQVIDYLGSTQTFAPGGGWLKCSLIAGTGGALELSFRAAVPANALDFFLWHPWVAWQVTGQIGAPPSAWGGYIPTVASAITMDTNGREQIVFYPGLAPANAAAIVISARFRRLLLGTLMDAPDGPHVSGYRQLKLGVSVSGEEQ